MVARPRDNRWRLRVIDLAGGGLAAACTAGLLWFTVLRTDRTSITIRELTNDIRAGRQHLAVLESELKEQRSTVRARRAQLEATGELPVHPPVEEYFRTLSRLAAGSAVRVLRQRPLVSRSYPGLLERRFAYEVSGRGPDLIRFLMEIEKGDFWADVSYVSIDGGSSAGSRAGMDSPRVAQLTISVFSALPNDEGSDSG